MDKLQTTPITPSTGISPKETRGSHILLGAVIALVFLSLAVIIGLFCRPLYIYNVRALNLPERTGLSEELILRQYDALIDYNTIGGSRELYFPDLPSSANGTTHFEEVRTIFWFFQGLFSVALIIAAGGIWYKRKSRPLYLKYAGLFSVILPTAIGILILLFWDWFFVAFHKITFRNDYWLFNETTDPIILLLPDQYFMHCAILIAVVFLVGGIISLLGYYLGGRIPAQLKK